MEFEKEPCTKLELMLAAWEALDCESVGARELRAIQSAVARHFGASAVDSPAAIARKLADEGAVLRHPEILEFDAKWRDRTLAKSSLRLDFNTLTAAVQSMEECERVRRELEQRADKQALGKLRDALALIRQELIFSTSRTTTSETDHSLAKEIADWLEIWLRTPELFSDWLDLRRSSTQFRQRFAQ